MSGHEAAPNPEQESLGGKPEVDAWVLGAQLHQEVLSEELARAGAPDDEVQSTLEHADSSVQLRKQQTEHSQK